MRPQHRCSGRSHPAIWTIHTIAVLMSCAAIASCSFTEPEPTAPGSLTFELEGDRVVVEGLVDSGTPDDLADFIERHPSAKLYALRMIEGSADDMANLEAARMIREQGITTLVESDGLVASGGTDLFLAGARRVVESGACIGVHSWADSEGEEGAELPEDAADHDLFLDYYAEMGIDEDFYWFTLDAAPADGMHWMTRAEMAAYGVATEYIAVDGADFACDEVD